jgi:hypothetical protein
LQEQLQEQEQEQGAGAGAASRSSFLISARVYNDLRSAIVYNDLRWVFSYVGDPANQLLSASFGNHGASDFCEKSIGFTRTDVCFEYIVVIHGVIYLCVLFLVYVLPSYFDVI